MTGVRGLASNSFLLALVGASTRGAFNTSTCQVLTLAQFCASPRRHNSRALFKMVALKALFVLATCTLVSGSAIPIWELLTKQEKMGRLMYVFIHLVDQYCKDSNIPDCQKVLTLYGMSNLVNEEENSLDFMDPYQRDSRSIIWEKVMKGDFKLPSGKTFYSNDPSSADDEDYELVNEVRDSSYPSSLSFRKNTNDPHPYAVRVPAPVKVATAHARAQTQADAQVGGISSSHPYAVRVAREATILSPQPVGIEASADFKPIRSERRLNPVFIQRILPRPFVTSFNSRRNSS